MIKSGSIALKEAEKEKRLKAICNLLGRDFFSEFFWELNKVQSELMQVEKQIASFGLHSEISTMEKVALSSKTELDRQEALLAGLEKKQFELQTTINSLKSEFTAGFKDISKDEQK